MQFVNYLSLPAFKDSSQGKEVVSGRNLATACMCGLISGEGVSWSKI